MSWSNAASRYFILILVACLSPVHIQHEISAATKTKPNFFHIPNLELIFEIQSKIYLPTKMPIWQPPPPRSKTHTTKHKEFKLSKTIKIIHQTELFCCEFLIAISAYDYLNHFLSHFVQVIGIGTKGINEISKETKKKWQGTTMNKCSNRSNCH